MSNPVGSINRLIPGLQPKGIEPTKATGSDKGEFTELFGKMLESVNDLQMDAGKAQELLASGDAEDLHQVMIAGEKAGIAMDLLLEVRNKLVDAYQSLIKMPM